MIHTGKSDTQGNLFLYSVCIIIKRNVMLKVTYIFKIRTKIDKSVLFLPIFLSCISTHVQKLI